MLPRVSARAPRHPGPPQDIGILELSNWSAILREIQARTSVRLARRDYADQVILRFLRVMGPAYSVEVGDALRVTVSAARAHLDRLERAGKLRSWWGPPRSATRMGRRYFEVASAE